MTVRIDQDRLVAPLEQVAAAPVAPVAPLRVNTVELTHALREIAIRRRNHRVVVIAHQAIRMAAPVERRHHLAQHFQELRAIDIVLVDRLAPIAARADVIQRAVEFNTDGSGHGRSLRLPMLR